MMKPLLLPALALLLAMPRPAHPAQCAENRDYYQSLPTVIGREDNSATFPFVLKCDTVFVRKGVTTVIHPGTLLYFAAPSLNSVIKVEGTLIVKGTKAAYVYLSGSLDTTKTGSLQPGSRQWGGIEVAESGRLEMEYAGVTRAPTPLTAFSDQVRIVNSFFKGSSGIILPDGSLMPLEISWHAINDLDLRKGSREAKLAGSGEEKGTGRISREEKAALLDRKATGFWTWKKAAGGAAALAVVAVGTAYLAGGDAASPPGTTRGRDMRDSLPPIPSMQP
jgi:hypothetical protein